jgi:hypothetical protein
LPNHANSDIFKILLKCIQFYGVSHFIFMDCISVKNLSSNIGTLFLLFYGSVQKWQCRSTNQQKFVCGNEVPGTVYCDDTGVYCTSAYSVADPDSESESESSDSGPDTAIK